MAKVVTAFIGGVAVGALAFFLLSRKEVQPPDATMNEPILPPATVVERAPREPLSVVPATTATRAPVEATRPTANTSTVADAASEPAPRNPIWLPGEFDWYATNPGFLSLQREDADPLWALQTESEVNQYFADRPQRFSKLGVPIVTCRTTGCQVLITVHGSDEPSLREDFRLSLLEDYDDQPWASSLGSVATNSENGVATLAWTFRRDPK